MEWKSVEGFNDFKVSDIGIVKRKKTLKSGKVKDYFWGKDINKRSDCHDHYITIPLSETKQTPIHILVAHAFIGPRPAGKEIHHKDFNKFNNAVSNLEYLTPLEHKAKHKAIHFKLIDRSLCGIASAYDKHNFTIIERMVTCEKCLDLIGVMIDGNGNIKTIKKRSEAYETYLNPRSVHISWDFSTKDSSLDKLWQAQG